MGAISTTPANTEQLTMLLTVLHACETAAHGDAHAAADTALARLRWAYEAAAIDAEAILTQAEEALSLG